MAEVPKLEDHGGDDASKWSMLPSPVETPSGDGGDPEPETPKKPEGAAEDAESAEQKERERLHKAIAHNYTSDIFKAAKSIEKPVSNAMDVFGWSLEDQQRLLDALNGLAAAEEEAAKKAAEDAKKAAEAAPVAPAASEAGDGGAAAATTGAPAESAPSTPDDSATKAAAAAAGATAAAAAAASAAPERSGGAGGEEEEESDETDTTAGAGAAEAGRGAAAETADTKEAKKKKTLKGLAARAILIAGAAAMLGGIFMSGGKQTKNEVETTITQEVDEDEEENESIRDRSTYHGMFASEDGSTYNSEKHGKRCFGEALKSDASEDEMREDLESRLLQPGQVAASYYYMQEKTSDPDFGVEGAKFNTPDDLLEAMEKDPDLHQRVYDYVKSIMDKSSYDEATLKGKYHNFYMDSAFETGDVDTSNVDVVGCTTYEDGTRAYVLRYVWMDENKIEHTDTFMFKERCGGQPVDEFDFTRTVRQVDPPQEDEEPTPDPTKTPEPTPGPETPPPDPTPDPDPTPTPPGPTPTPEGKTPDSQERNDRGLEGLHVDQQDQEGDVSDERPDPAPGPGSEEYENRDDDNGGDHGGDDNGGANGENTSEDENRTPEDQQQHEEDQKGHEEQEQADQNEDRSEGDENAGKTDEEAAEDFANGDF